MYQNILKQVLKKIKRTKIVKKLFVLKTLRKMKKEKKISRNKNNLQLKINTSTKADKNKVAMILGFLIIITTLITLSFLKVKTIQVIKGDDISDITIAYKSLDKYRGDFLFLLKNNEIKESLLNYQNNLEKISITRVPPSTLKVNIKSYDSDFKTSLYGKSYLVTENGVLTPTNKENEGKDVLEIYSKEKFNFPEYKKLLSKNSINKIKEIKKLINDNLLSISIDKIGYYIIEREAHFHINNSTILIFDLNSEIQKQAEKLFILNKEYQNLAKPGIVYIDLRIRNKIFYCKTENQKQCEKNLEKVYDIKK